MRPSSMDGPDPAQPSRMLDLGPRLSLGLLDLGFGAILASMDGMVDESGEGRLC